MAKFIKQSANLWINSDFITAIEETSNENTPSKKECIIHLANPNYSKQKMLLSFDEIMNLISA